MRIGANLDTVKHGLQSKKTDVMKTRFTMEGYVSAQAACNDAWVKTGGNRMQKFEAQTASGSRSEAEKIYEAAASGGKNPVGDIRQISKVPYGYLAKDGIITYNGVTFVCDERTHSICLGDMSNEKNVLNIPLSGGGQLRVNRDSLGALSKAIGMFSPEDVNLILRAIAQDTKVQSMQQELEDMENEVGQSLESSKE